MSSDLINLLSRIDDPNLNQHLKSLETRPLFFSHLLYLLQPVHNHNNPLQIGNNLKLIAIIHFKNTIDKYWRKGSENPLPIEEKNQLRIRLIDSIGLPIKQLATQHALAIAKIARLDYPLEWPSLFNDIITRVKQILDSPENDAKQFCLLPLKQCIKTLASKTIANSRRAFKQISLELFMFCSSLFKTHVSTLVNLCTSVPESNSTSPMDTFIYELKYSLISLKSILQMIQQLILYGFQDSQIPPNVFDTISQVLSLQKHLLTNRTLLFKINGQVAHATDKLILRIGKIFLSLAQYRLVTFILLPQFLDVMSLYWETLQNIQEDRDEMMKRIQIQGLILFKYINKHPTSSLSDVRSPSVVESYTLVHNQLLTEAFIPRFFQHLIINFLILTQDDLESWQEDPESFVSEEEADHWEHHLRACTEKLIMDLMSNHKNILSPLLLNMMKSSMETQSQVNPVVQEAVYNAFGLCAHDLYDDVDFDNWCLHSLIPQLSIVSNSPMQRRICILIGKWISIKASKALRPHIYKALLQLISNNSTADLVVRLTALLTLKFSLDDWEFDVEGFKPFIEPCISNLVKLMEELDDEFKIKIIQVLGIMIERIGMEMKLHFAKVLNLIPDLWMNAEGHYLFQSNILVLVTKMVQALQNDGDQIQPMAVNILRHAVDVKQPSHIYLYEDGLELWLLVIQCASKMTPELLSLFPLATALLDFGTENLRIVLKIIESYLLLDAVSVLNENALPLFSQLSAMLKDVTPEAAKCILSCVDLAMMTCYQSNALEPLIQVLIQSGLLGILIHHLKENKEMGFILVGYLNIFSRYCSLDVLSFVRFATGPDGDTSPLFFLVSCWIEHYDKMATGNTRRLACLALSCLFSLHHSSILQQYTESILVILSSTLYESKDFIDQLHQFGADDGEEYEETSESDKTKRNHLKIAVDYVYSPKFDEMVRNHVMACVAKHPGGMDMFEKEIMSAIDPDVLTSFKSALMLE